MINPSRDADATLTGETYTDSGLLVIEECKRLQDKRMKRVPKPTAVLQREYKNQTETLIAKALLKVCIPLYLTGNAAIAMSRMPHHPTSG